MDRQHIKYFDVNECGRDFVVGDIHGCIKEFNDALRSVRFDKEVDRVFCVGDLVDRGPDSLRCLDLLLEPWFHSVKGNHEVLWYFAHLRFFQSDRYIFLHNGGELLDDEEQIKKYASLIEEMPYLIEVNTKSGRKIGIVHAEIPSYINSWNSIKNMLEQSSNPDTSADIDMHPISSLVWGRSRISKFVSHSNVENLFPKVEGIDEIYVGHTIVPEPIKYQQFNYIDCGAVLSYWLSESKLQEGIKEGRYNDPRLIIMEIL